MFMVVIKIKKNPLLVVIILLPIIVLIFLLLLYTNKNLTLEYLIGGLYICILVETPLLFVHFRNAQISQLKPKSVPTQIVKKTFIRELEYTSENLYTYNNRPALSFRFKDNMKIVEITFWVSDEVYNTSYENQCGILTFKRKKNKYFFVSFEASKE